MAKVYEKAFFGDSVKPITECSLLISSSAVLYGLSVYTVLPVHKTPDGFAAFNISSHFKRLLNSSKIIGIDTFTANWSEDKFMKAIRQTIEANNLTSDVFVRATVHVDEQVPGTRSRGLKTTLSIFLYEAKPILPMEGARLKTSLWRRVPDYSIPSRAKVNGAYVNSVLAKQDAIDSGYDDCIFLDINGHVCELSAGNIFAIRNGTLITPDNSSDILEGITRDFVVKAAEKLGYQVEQRNLDLTELYVADEVFACGTSTYVAPVVEIDNRMIGYGKPGQITKELQSAQQSVLRGESGDLDYLLTYFN